MSREAMKMALEALEKLVRFESDSWEIGSCRIAGQATKALREALAEQPAQQEPDWLDKEQAETDWDHVWLLIKAASYASSRGFISGTTNWGSAVSRYMRNESPQPAQQEPVAWMDGYRNIYSLEEKAAGCPEATIALVPMANHEKTSGSPIKELNCICGAVWEGDELVHLPRPPAHRKPLTREQVKDLLFEAGYVGAEESADFINGLRHGEAAHGIKEQP